MFLLLMRGQIKFTRQLPKNTNMINGPLSSIKSEVMQPFGRYFDWARARVWFILFIKYGFLFRISVFKIPMNDVIFMFIT